MLRFSGWAILRIEKAGRPVYLEDSRARENAGPAAHDEPCEAKWTQIQSEAVHQVDQCELPPPRNTLNIPSMKGGERIESRTNLQQQQQATQASFPGSSNSSRQHGPSLLATVQDSSPLQIGQDGVQGGHSI